MGDALRMEVPNAHEDLLETTLDLRGGHASLADSVVQISAGTKLHHDAPSSLIVLHEIDGLDDIRLMQRTRDAKF